MPLSRQAPGRRTSAGPPTVSQASNSHAWRAWRVTPPAPLAPNLTAKRPDRWPPIEHGQRVHGHDGIKER